MNTPYEIIEVQQGSEEWKQERLKRVTASQVPSLLSLSPYQTSLQLLQEKLSGQEAEVSSFKQHLFQKGHDAEKAAREWVESHLKIKFPPLVVVSTRVPDLLASLDGFNREAKLILEAKYMGVKALEEMKAGKFKRHHECQIQAQLLATGAEKCIYFATTDNGASAIAEIKPDPAYAEKITQAVQEFSKDLLTFTEMKQQLVNKYSPPKRAKGDIFPIRRR